MESLDSLRHLFEYDYWGNREALRSVESLEAPPERALKIAGHIIGAQRVWLGRLEASGAPPVPWPAMSLQETNAAFSEMRQRWNAFLAALPPGRLDEELVHKNSKGAEFRAPVRDVLMQLVMHGAYHRGQIAAVVRDAGGTPSSTDYITYVRKQRMK
jgi:uncharacterized damage-inducible protein DinB